MTWSCPAIDHGITIYPNGKISPCCHTVDYFKPIADINDPARFSDLKTIDPPLACQRCIDDESRGISSYRDFYNQHAGDGDVQFLDIRNTNQCNLKCRYCGPHFSNQWAKEIEISPALLHTDIDVYLDQLLTPDLKLIYFTGGEPLISADHWKVLDTLIQKGYSHDIKLMYNTNLTVLKYKDIDINEVWSQFKSVNVFVSIDDTGNRYDYIRSGSRWQDTLENIKKLKSMPNVTMGLACVVSALNIWNLDQLVDYCKDNDLKISFMVLTGPDYLALDVIPNDLKPLALAEVEKLQRKINPGIAKKIKDTIENNHNQDLFIHTLGHILLLDKLRGENLFDELPFAEIAKRIFLGNTPT